MSIPSYPNPEGGQSQYDSQTSKSSHFRVVFSTMQITMYNHRAHPPETTPLRTPSVEQHRNCSVYGLVHKYIILMMERGNLKADSAAIQPHTEHDLSFSYPGSGLFFQQSCGEIRSKFQFQYPSPFYTPFAILDHCYEYHSPEQRIHSQNAQTAVDNHWCPG